MKEYLPAAASIASFGGCILVGHRIGTRFGHPIIGGIAGAIIGLPVANMVGDIVDSSVIGVTPVIENNNAAPEESPRDTAKKKVADIIANPPKVNLDTSDAGAVTQSFIDMTAPKPGVATRAIDAIAPVIPFYNPPVDSRYTRTSATRQESRDETTFAFNPRLLRVRG